MINQRILDYGLNTDQPTPDSGVRKRCMEEVKHSGIRVVTDLTENEVPRLGPDVNFTIIVYKIFLVPLDHDPFDP